MRTIYCRDITTNHISTFSSILDASIFLKISASHVEDNLRRKTNTLHLLRYIISHDREDLLTCDVTYTHRDILYTASVTKLNGLEKETHIVSLDVPSPNPYFPEFEKLCIMRNAIEALASVARMSTGKPFRLTNSGYRITLIAHAPDSKSPATYNPFPYRNMFFVVFDKTTKTSSIMMSDDILHRLCPDRNGVLPVTVTSYFREVSKIPRHNVTPHEIGPYRLKKYGISELDAVRSTL